MTQSRYNRQIENLLALQPQIQGELGPLDQRLARLFRANKKYGSKDRNFIQGALFGRERWWGWLRKMNLSLEETLAWGYLLDDNEINELIIFWGQRLGFPSELLETLGKADLAQKLRLAQTRNPELTLDDLNPSFFPKWTLERHQAFQERAGLWLRVRQGWMEVVEKELQSKSIPYERDGRLPLALLVQKRLNLQELEAYQQGFCEVQDYSSQMVSLIAAPQPGESWLDFCAGAGGKSLHLADQMQGQGEIWALDIREGSLFEARRRMEKAGVENIHLLHWQGKVLPQILQQPWQGIVVDAPCSCSGVVRRSPWLRWELGEDQIRDYQSLQWEILDQAATLVPVGGKLLYATCSILPEENEEVVQGFLQKHPGFVLVPFVDPCTGKLTQGLETFFPPQSRGDGMFAALLRKEK